MSKVPKAASAEGARHSRKKLALRRANASPSTVKAGPDHPQSLERTAFVSFWLSRYVFLGPPWESVSPAVFTLASLLAEGVRLPLASFYLGGLYGRLDQLQEQMFLCYGPVKRVPKPPCGENKVSEYRVQSWFLGCPRIPLVDVIDDENRFVFRPYTSTFVLGVEDTPARARVKTKPSQKGKAKLCVSAPPFKKVPKKAPSSAKRPFSQVSAPRRSSERLRARPIQGSLRCPSSSSSGHFSDSDEEGTGEAFGKSQDPPSLSNPPRSDSTHHTSVLHANLVTGPNDSRASEHMPPGQPHVMIRHFSVEVVNYQLGFYPCAVPFFQTFSEKDSRLLKEFFERHAGFLLSESYPSSYQRLAYEQFLDLLKRLRSNSILALLGPLKSEILDKLKMLSCLGFKGAWFDELMSFFHHSVSPSVFEDSGKISEAVKMLQSKIDKEKASLALHESELSKLLTRRK
ncbi:Aminotransferase-like, plant mobile domain [Sesbania bispinosa]|nr:Aminotransferase-like, plant mobile domain [Sesbania bispinosa]